MGAHPTVRPEVVRLFNEGLSYENIAKAVGIPREHVRQHVFMARSLGEIAGDHQRLRHKYGEKREAVYQHLLEGKTPQQISDSMGISKHAVHHHIRSMRANPRDRDRSVLRYRQPKSLLYIASKAVEATGKQKGRMNEFFQGLVDQRTVMRLCHETPRGMTVMEYAAKLVVDAFAEDNQ
jgi:predicted ArsR family transcriptional regulator